MKYLAKPKTWYDQFTEVEIISQHGSKVLCFGKKYGQENESLCEREQFIEVQDDYDLTEIIKDYTE